MTYSIVHLSDPHFGGEADLARIGALEDMMPDLAPDLVVVSGDLTVRARHGEFQAAREWLRELERSAPVFVIPGNHDVQWWRRPLLPYGSQAIYAKYRTYFGPVLAPLHRSSEVVVAGVHTAHGLAWRSLGPDPREWTVTGHLTAREMERVSAVFQRAEPGQARIIVMHHNVLRGEQSGRMGLVRWKRVHRWLMESGADLVLCGHDPLNKTDVMGGVVISCAGALARRAPEDRPAAFHRIVIEETAIQIEPYLWDRDRRHFRRTDVLAFARQRVKHVEPVPAGII